MRIKRNLHHLVHKDSTGNDLWWCHTSDNLRWESVVQYLISWLDLHKKQSECSSERRNANVRTLNPSEHYFKIYLSKWKYTLGRKKMWSCIDKGDQSGQTPHLWLSWDGVRPCHWTACCYTAFIVWLKAVKCLEIFFFFFFFLPP